MHIKIKTLPTIARADHHTKMKKILNKPIELCKPHDLTNEEFEAFRDEAQRLYNTDDALFIKSMEICNNLGVGGLWRGGDAARVILYYRMLKNDE